MLSASAVVAKLGLDLIGENALQMTLPVVAVVMLAVYVILVRIAAAEPDLEEGLSASEMKSLPLVSTVAKTGYYFILPIVVLLWCVLVNRLSPGLSALRLYRDDVCPRHTASSESLFPRQARDAQRLA